MAEDSSSKVSKAAQDVLHGMLQTQFEGVVSDGDHIAPGVMLQIAEDGVQTVTCRLDKDAGLQVKMNVEHPAAWIGLHLQLGELDLSDLAALGLYTKNTALRACTYRVSLRSGTPDGFVDTFFDKDVVAYAASSQHADTILFAEHTALPRHSTWREIILFFHVEDFDLTLQDLRLFAA